MDSDLEFLNVRQTAERLGIHENTVRRYAMQGRLTDARVPGTPYFKFRASEVERLKAHRGTPVVSLAAERRMVSPELATASQLAGWPETNAREAQDRLPELVRRLLWETPGASQISIRAGDGVALAGKDGVATLQRQTQLLPEGQIWFEFGTDKDSKRKATKDYDQRKSEASPQVTFIFVTVRRWQGKAAWAEQRRAEELFKDVRVLDADDLEAWLQVAPVAHLWVSEMLGFRPRHARTLESWWDGFRARTRPALPQNLFLAGRAKEAQELRAMLQQEPGIISIQTEWTDDALGFLHASLTVGEDQGGQPVTVVIVDDVDVWDRILALPGSGILVPNFDNADVTRARARGRHVVSIVDSESTARRKVDIRLPRVERAEAADAFRAAGVAEWTGAADQLAVLARRSMPALVRRLSVSQRVREPAWSQPPLANTLTALMLACRWTDQPEDMQVLSELAGIPTAEVQSAIADASAGSDPAIRKVGNVYMFTSLEEAFLKLRARISLALASRWAQIATSVLLDPDPYEGLTTQERITAQLQGQRPTYSHTLRRGIADSLALAGSLESTPDHTDHILEAERVVRDVLVTVVAGAEGRSWAAVADVLPLLAEAAPEAFLSELERDLESEEPSVGRLFEVSDDPLTFGPSGQQHHLLWALEVLSWSPDHLVRATRILAKLCRYQLPKNAGNNPLASMSSVLCGSARNTGADLERRLQALDACRSVSTTTGWALLKALWPDRGAVFITPSEPRYHLWKPTSRQVPISAWLEFVKGLADRALEWAEADRVELPWLVKALSTVDPYVANRIFDFLEAEAARGDLDADVRLELFEQVREIAAEHESSPKARWAMPQERLTRLRRLEESLRPDDDPRRFSRLFGWRQVFLDWRLEFSDEDLTYDEHFAKLEAKRREVLDGLFTKPDGWQQLAAITVRAEAPTLVGRTLSTYPGVEVLDTMLEWLESENVSLQEAAGAWVGSHLAIHGPADLWRVLERGDVVSPGHKRFVLNVPPESRFWDVLHEYPDAEDLYWTEARFEAVRPEDRARAIEFLLKWQRAWSAIAVASHGIFNPTADQKERFPSVELVLSVLRAAVTQDPGTTLIRADGVAILLDYLDRAELPVSDLASLEFSYFKLLEYQREPRALNRDLATDPSRFVELVCRAYLGTNERNRPSKDPQAARYAGSVLDGWHGFPGRRADGTLDAAAMQQWVRQARLQLSDLYRADIGDELIGGTFAYAPVDADGIWPPVPVRDLIESIGSHDLENGVYLGRRNSRGGTSRGIYEVREQERKLAEQYKEWSQGVEWQWPRTARILRKIAKSYEEDAAYLDRRAQLRQDGD